MKSLTTELLKYSIKELQYAALVFATNNNSELITNVEYDVYGIKGSYLRQDQIFKEIVRIIICAV